MNAHIVTISLIGPETLDGTTDLTEVGKATGSSTISTELSRAVRDSKYATFGGLELAHIATTETPFPEKNWWRCSVSCGASVYVAFLRGEGAE